MTPPAPSSNPTQANMCFRLILIATGLLGLLATPALTQEKFPPEHIRFFETNIRPNLIKYCYECHSQKERSSRGGLLLDTRKAILQGGDNGPVAVPGNLGESMIWDAVNWQHGYDMPPDEPMPKDVVAHFKTWIEMGLPDPRVREVTEFNSKITKEQIEEGKKHWAFQLPKRPSIVGGASIDRIINVKLQEANLRPAARADALTLLRRMNFDLIGLPPKLSEMKKFQAAWDQNPDDAVQAKLDELLARPQFGEQWGRHWLDVARYAQSSGSRNISYPHAWRYRDYVIDAFNKDKPYDRFVQEQIAGDLLPAATDEQWQESLIGTGFLAIGLKHHDEKNPRKFASDMVDEQINTLTQGFLGLTVACARCHDHKYDPIPTQDYYAMAGIFHSTDTYFGTQRVAQNHRTSPLLTLPVPDDVPVAQMHGPHLTLDQMKARLAGFQEEMFEMNAARRRQGPRDRNDGPDKDKKALRNEINRIQGQINALNEDGTPKSAAMGVQERTQMVNAHILLGGELERPAQRVNRGFLQVLGDLNFEASGDKNSGRRQLANAFSTSRNPLTARVMVNRVWMHLMGRPIVPTPNNFGFSGMKPENQALLDHLAIRFMVERKWSVKHLVRDIVLSDAYQRASTYNPDNYAVDPDNKLLWRANARPLTAEELRDATLALSGEIDLDRPLGSPAIGGGRPKTTAGGATSQAIHRSVYLPVVRDAPDEMMKVFDFPDANVTSASRAQSIVPTQALFMMNSDFMTRRGQAMAARMEHHFDNPTEQIKTAFQLAYGRPATTEELKAAVEFFNDFNPAKPAAEAPAPVRPGGRRPGGRRGPAAPAPPAVLAENDKLAIFCQTLMASARFRIVN